MENNISNSDKTDEVHIEEYDKTDSIQSDEYGFEDIESEEPEDVDFEDEIDDDELETTPGVKASAEKKSITDMIGKQLPALANIFNRVKKKKATKVDEDPAELSSDEPDEAKKAKPKFKLTPIHIVVILGLVVLLFLGDEEPEVTTAPVKPTRENIPERKVVEPENEPTVADDFSENTVDEDTPVVPETATDVEDSMADIRMENTPEQVDPPETSDTEASDLEDFESNDPTVTPSIDSRMGDVELDIDTSPRASDQPSGESMDSEVISDTVDATEELDVAADTVEQTDIVEEDLEDPVVSEAPEVVPDKAEEIVPQEIVDPALSSDMTKKLLENLQVKLKKERVEQKLVEQIRPVGAPSYDSPGSGLVYNCRGGHWACIDADEYRKCRQNFSWNKSETIPIECYPMAFLETDFDCGTVQQEKVNSVPDLSFCE